MKYSTYKWTKLLKSMPPWSATMKVTLCLYALFIMFVLSISFPLKSHKNKMNANPANGIQIANDIDDSDFNENELKLLQRARDLPIFNNRSDILRDAFKK